MARKGEGLDNAVAESFFGSLKNELAHHKNDRSRAEARR
jgi:transposase InsO family protein